MTTLLILLILFLLILLLWEKEVMSGDVPAVVPKWFIGGLGLIIMIISVTIRCRSPGV